MTESANLVERVRQVGPRGNLGPGVWNRFVVVPEELADQLPFVLLVEDFIEPGVDFHAHPHRGLETVTFVLSGQLQHADDVGNKGTIEPGGVQWMTAGRGIVHGGAPVPGSPVHALQLWVALPAALRNSAPGTREQQRDSADVVASGGSRAHVYGARSVAAGDDDWSRWPVTLTDVELASGGRHVLTQQAAERSFLYILEGTVFLSGRSYVAGTVLWLTATDADRAVEVSCASAARLVQYSSPIFDEPIVARGPFVLGSDAEVARAFRELRANGSSG